MHILTYFDEGSWQFIFNLNFCKKNEVITFYFSTPPFQRSGKDVFLTDSLINID